MRISELITELTGAKKHPAFQAVKGLEQNRGGGEWDSQQVDSVNKQLADLGWTMAGAGHYANVYENPDKPYVLKLYRNDQGYDIYLKIMLANQKNPHVPRIYGRPIQLSPNVNAVRLEKLTPLSGENDPVLRAYVDPHLPPTLENALETEEDNAEFLKQNHPQLFELILKLAPVIQYNSDWDLHNPDNVMKRGDTLVITDP